MPTPCKYVLQRGFFQLTYPKKKLILWSNLPNIWIFGYFQAFLSSGVRKSYQNWIKMTSNLSGVVPFWFPKNVHVKGISSQSAPNCMPCPFTGPKMFCAGPNFLSQSKNLNALMPCPFTSPKMFWVGPNFLCQTKNFFTYCGSHKHFVQDKKMIYIQ